MALHPIMQSGFVAKSDKHLILPNPIEPSVREAVIYKAFKSPLAEYHYSKVVTDMFNRWSANRDAIRDFDFRERILKTAFEVFEFKNFREWLEFQAKSKKLSALHGKFLLETVEHVCTGSPRRVQSLQWIALLEAGDQAKSVHVDPQEFLKIKHVNSGYAYVPPTFEELITMWTRQREGFEDLLISMYVIFGARARQSNVTDLSH